MTFSTYVKTKIQTHIQYLFGRLMKQNARQVQRTRTVKSHTPFEPGQV